ncbi:DUF6541 family protein [Blastococcus sp. SYSU DS0539]
MSLPDVLVPVVSVLVLVLPGTALALLAGMRLGTAVAVSPVITYGVTTATATAASYLSFSWNPLTLVVVTVLAALLVLGIRLLAGRGLPWRDRVAVERFRRPDLRDLAVVGGVLGGGLLSAGVLLSGFGRLGAPNQDWDYVFHASAVRLIADSGDIAPEAMARINDWESTTFYYPNTFHALGAVVQDLTGATTFEVLNSQAMIVCLITGLGLAGLLHRLRAPLTVTAVTPLLLAGFSSFPYDVLWRGPLLPYAAGVAVIPAFILLLVVTLSVRRPAVVLLFALGAAGLLGLHPSSALSAALFLLVHLVARWWQRIRLLPRDFVLLASAGVAALVIAAPAVIGAIFTGTEGADVDWPAVEGTGQAVGDLLLLNHQAQAPQYWLAALLVVGLFTAFRARYMWPWLGGAGIGFLLFVMAASSDSELVASLTRPWWNDRWRFAALAVLGFAPLAAHGLRTLAVAVEGVLRRWAGARADRVPARWSVLALALVGLLGVIVASNGLYAPRNSERIARNHQDDRMLDQAEIEAMEWLADNSSGGTVMNDANDGSAYLRAVTGMRPLFGHIVEPRMVPRMGPTQRLLLGHFNCLDADPDVRAAIEELDIRYVFLGSGFIRPEYTRVAGLEGVEASPSLDLVHRGPGVQVYEIDLADAPSDPVPACELPEQDDDTAAG